MKLLASVRNLEEALVAAACEVDLIDLKEPTNGALGAVSLEIAAKVGQQLGSHTTLSLAFGELCAFDHIEMFDSSVLSHFSYCKIGLSHCGSLPGWQRIWREWFDRVSRCSEPVLVAYADNVNCRAPSIQETIDLAIDSPVRYVLIDTWNKQGHNLFDFISPTALHELIEPLLAKEITVAIAGSLTTKDLNSVHKVGAGIIGLRGALCDDNDRTGRLSPERIADWKSRINHHSNEAMNAESVH